MGGLRGAVRAFAGEEGSGLEEGELRAEIGASARSLLSTFLRLAVHED